MLIIAVLVTKFSLKINLYLNYNSINMIIIKLELSKIQLTFFTNLEIKLYMRIVRISKDYLIENIRVANVNICVAKIKTQI